MNASHTELRYIGPAFLNSATINPKLKKQTIEFFTGACSRSARSACSPDTIAGGRPLPCASTAS